MSVEQRRAIARAPRRGCCSASRAWSTKVWANSTVGVDLDSVAGWQQAVHLGGRAGVVERPLERQRDLDAGLVDHQARASGGAARTAQGGGLDRAHQVQDPPVLQPHLVVEEAPQLLGDLPHGALGALGRLRPVVVDRAESPVRVDRVEALHPAEQLGELVLARLGEQEVVERLEAAALVGGGDVGAAARRARPAARPSTRPRRRSSPARRGRARGSSPPPRGSRPAARGRWPRPADTGRGRRWRRARSARRPRRQRSRRPARRACAAAPTSRVSGSVSEPCTIWRSSSTTVCSRDSVPTNARTCRPSTQA